MKTFLYQQLEPFQSGASCQFPPDQEWPVFILCLVHEGSGRSVTKGLPQALWPSRDKAIANLLSAHQRLKPLLILYVLFLLLLMTSLKGYI